MAKVEPIEALGERTVQILEDNDISVSVDDNGRYYEVSLEFWSPAGEDVPIELECYDADDFLKEFREYAQDFDVDDHVKGLVNSTLSGVPQSVAVLVEDAQAIKQFLDEVADKLDGIEVTKETTVTLSLTEDVIDKLVASEFLVDYDRNNEKAIASAITSMIENLTEPEISIPREDVIAWGKENLPDVNWGKTTIDLSPVSYDDYVRTETIMNAFHEYSENTQGYEKFAHYLESVVYENSMAERVCDAEYDLYEQLKNRAYDVNEEFGEAFEAYADELPTYEFLEQMGYEGCNYDVADFMKNDYRLDLILGTSREQNEISSEINDFFTADVQKFDEKAFETLSDNALTYLVHQQGHSVEEVFEAMSDNKNDNTFIQTVADEVNSTTYETNRLAVLITAKGENLLNLLDNIAHGRDNIKISEHAMLGLHDGLNGAGGNLEITLEKDLVIPASLVQTVQFESSGSDDRVGSRENYGGYTVNEVSDLIGTCWTKGGFAETTAENPVLYEEKIGDVRANLCFKDTIEKPNNKKDKSTEYNE